MALSLGPKLAVAGDPQPRCLVAGQDRPRAVDAFGMLGGAPPGEFALGALAGPAALQALAGGG
eukprot:3568134-Lingulodinium_polyedra.AAC.1